MGGPGSGSLPDDFGSRGGRAKKAAVAVVGSGVPVKPKKMPAKVAAHWDRIVDRLQGVVYEQDSDALARMAFLSWQAEEYEKAQLKMPTDEELTRLSLAVVRQLSSLWSQFGMTSRSRQILLVPREEEAKDEFEQLMESHN